MAGFSQTTLERIRAASDIVDIIGGYLPLKKAGANFTALCPFHKEKSPSFNVNPHKQIFHCFGCHKGGDVFTFVKEYENIGFVDAVRRLAERAKIPLEFDNNPAEQQSRHLKDQLLEIHEKITQRWQNCLLNEAAGQTARDYLAKALREAGHTVDVAGNGDVDEEHGTIASALQEVLAVGAAEDFLRRAGGGDNDVGPGSLRVEIVERDGLGMDGGAGEVGCQFFGSRFGAVGDEDGGGTVFDEMAGG